MTAYNSTNPKHIAIQRRSAKEAQDAFDAFLNHSMGMVAGRRYFHSLLVRCHVFANPYTGRAGSTAFACGELNVGQQVLADIMRVCPDEYVQMMREANGRELTDDTRRSRSDEDSDRDDPGPEYVHPAYERTAKDGGGAGGLDYNHTERDEDPGDEG